MSSPGPHGAWRHPPCPGCFVAVLEGAPKGRGRGLGVPAEEHSLPFNKAQQPLPSPSLALAHALTRNGVSTQPAEGLPPHGGQF